MSDSESGFYWNIWSIGIATILFLSIFTKWSTGYFARKGIKNLPYRIPLIGNMAKVLIRTEHLKDLIKRAYNAFPNETYIGLMMFSYPVILIKDLDLVKQIALKDFEHFVNHYSTLSEDADPLLGKNLFSLTDEKWRDMRATLSPAFTSSKMRNMFQFVVDIGKQTTDFYLDQMKQSKNKDQGLVEIELKDAFIRYANDVIATSAFGIKVNSLADRENQFYKEGNLATFTGVRYLKFLLFFAFPKLYKVLKIKFLSEHTSNFFRNLILSTMQNREKNDIIRHDMIQILMEAKKGSLKHESNHDDRDAGFATVEESNLGKQTIKRKWTDDDLIAQALLFFTAGFDTSSTLLCFIGHELAINPDIQKRLQDEIDEIASEKKFNLEYNDLAKMKYMDMVVTEALRKWPPILITDRKCAKKYDLPSDNSTQKYTINVGEAIYIPIYGFHHDPQYYPNPEIFDPERFSDENKHNLNPFAFMPFGVGPRNCIGSRFALMQTKAIIFHLLAKFDIVVTSKTQNPIKISNETFHLVPERGFWVGLKPRKFQI